MFLSLITGYSGISTRLAHLHLVYIPLYHTYTISKEKERLEKGQKNLVYATFSYSRFSSYRTSHITTTNQIIYTDRYKHFIYPTVQLDIHKQDVKRSQD